MATLNAVMQLNPSLGPEPLWILTPPHWQVHFPRRDASSMRRALLNSFASAALLSEGPGERGAVLGFARAVSDGVFNATVWCECANFVYLY